MRRWSPNTVARASLLLLLACGSNKNVAMGGAVGTGHESDGGEPVVDAGQPKARDASTYDMQLFDGNHYLCGYDQSDKSAFAGNAAQRVLASATDDTGFALVHLDAIGNLLIEALPIDGQADAPVVLLNAEERVEATALAANGSHFLLAWRAAGDMQSQSLRTRELSSDGAGVVEHSSMLELGDGGGELFALSALGSGFALGYREQREGKSVLSMKKLDASGNVSGDPQTIDTMPSNTTPPHTAPQHLQLARTEGGGSLLAWLERDSSGVGKVFGLPLSDKLAANGQINALSKNPVGETPFGLAARMSSEGLIYHAKDGAVRDTVKYRRVETSGVTEQAVLNVVDAPARARDGSISPFGQGYAVAYRKLPSLGDGKATVHVAFVNQYGQSVYDAELADSSEDPGSTTVSATADGHVFVAWTNTLPGSATTSAVKLYCPGALVLCGGH